MQNLENQKKDKTHTYNAEQKKPDTEEYTLWVHLCEVLEQAKHT